MELPHDPLGTARTGGIDSYFDVGRDDDARGFLGEVLVCEGGETRTRAGVRGVKITQLTAGYGQAYVLDDEGKAHDLVDKADARPEGVEVDVPLQNLALGKGFGAGVGLEDARLYTWGAGGAGQLGLGHTRGSAVPEVVPAVSSPRFAAVACGELHGAALTEGGAVYTWGRGFEGQLGQGTVCEIDFEARPFQAVRLAPKVVQALSKRTIVKVACGARFTAAIDSRGAVWTWGEGLVGQLGTGRCTRRSVPAVAIGPAGKGAQYTARSSTTTPRDEVADYMDVLPEEAREHLIPSETAPDEGGEAAVEDEAVAAAADPEDAGDAARQVSKLDLSRTGANLGGGVESGSGSGSGSGGGAGDGSSRGNQEASRQFFVDLCCGEGHVLALDQTGALCTWGFNVYGQLGCGDVRSKYEPLFIETPPLARISASRYSSAAVTSDGKVLAWGLNAKGKAVRAPETIPVSADKKDACVNLAEARDNGGVVVLVPTCATSILPSNGPLAGNHPVTIVGVGFWESGNIKVRFVPMRLSAQESSLDDGSESEDSDVDLDAAMEDDVASLGSSSASSSEAAQDLRVIEEVDGVFDPASGGILCTAPPCAQAGISLVQVAMDGVTYTKDEVLYVYTEPCSVASIEPRAALCTAEEPGRELELRISGVGFFSMPELSVQLSAGDKRFTLPASLWAPEQQVGESCCATGDKAGKHEDGDADSAEERSVLEETQTAPGAAAEQGPAMVIARVNLNGAIEALQGEGEHAVQALVSVSLNGLTFSMPCEAERQACTLRLGRLRVNRSSPASFPCVEDEPPSETEPAEAEAEEAEEGAEAWLERVKFAEDETVRVQCDGLLPSDGEFVVDPTVRLTFATKRGANGEAMSFTIPATADLEAGVVSFHPPRLGRQEWLQNGQGWGYLCATLEVSLDAGACWATLEAPFTFYWGQFGQPKPHMLLRDGGVTFELPVADGQAGWLFETCEPTVRISAGEASAIELGQADVSRSADGNMLVCSLPSLCTLHSAVCGTRLAAETGALREAILAQRFPEGVPEPDETNQSDLDAANAEADEAAARDAPALAFASPVALSVAVTVNGLHQIGVGEPAAIVVEEPDLSELAPASAAFLDLQPTEKVDEPGEAEAEEAEAEAEAAAEVDQSLTVTLVASASTGVFALEEDNLAVRFCHENGAHVIEARATLVPLSATGAVVEDDKAKAKKKKAEEPEEPVWDLFRRQLQIVVPALPEPGVYQISVAWNGRDFGGRQVAFEVVAPEAENEEEGEGEGEGENETKA